jgi:hypothetical protein
MVIALFNEATDEIIFTSTGSSKPEMANMNPREAQVYANDVVAMILRDLPPGGRSIVPALKTGLTGSLADDLVETFQYPAQLLR